MKKLLFLSKNYEVKKITRVEINSFLLKKLKDFLPKIKSKEISGSSPPEVFVGRIGYPKVFVGPMVSPLENSEELLYTENWFGKRLEEIFALRFQAVRGKSLAKVKDLNDRKILELQDALLSKKSVNAEAKFKNFPRGFRISLDHQPFGPSAFLEDFKLYPSSTDFKLEKVYYDFDFKASEAIFWLYRNNVPISKIQQALSIGMIGIKRKLVPTRWSITAVDDTIGKFFLEKVKTFPLINEFRVYYKEYLDNRWIILMFPSYWKYESIEAWYPGIITDSLAIGGDYEGFEFKKEYASIGGCWYAARAMVSEKLFEERRQAGVL
ncbi:MAG: Nre family DNA repair protein, partial [Candidatus Aenigmatarchaeota archaeon]